MSDKRTPSLLEPQSRGGENAGRGFDFQDYFLVSQIPCWLEWDGFVSLVREGIGDIEVKFVSPGHQDSIELIEVKNHRLTPSVFWDEVDRFYAIDQGSPNTFRWFRLVSPDISDEVAPFQQSLRRLKSPYGFYPDDSGVAQNSFDDFVHQCDKVKKTRDYAGFLFRRMLIDTGYSAMQENGEAIFRQHFGQYLPEYRSVSYSTVSTIYQTLLKLIAPRNTPLTRKLIEETIRACIPPDQLTAHAPVRLHTAIKRDELSGKEIVLDWEAFSGGGSRTYPPSHEWNKYVIGALNETKDFILNHRSTRHIKITGSRRLSSSLAIGSVFSATGGFVVSMEYRDGVWWRTNDHATSEDDAPLNIEFPEGQNTDLIVSMGIPNNIRQSVELYSKNRWNPYPPQLNIHFTHAVQHARQANSVVAQVKGAIIQSLRETQAKKIHLFYAGPSFIALLIGHRLNATATIQCYEYIGPNMYTPTWELNP